MNERKWENRTELTNIEDGVLVLAKCRARQCYCAFQMCEAGLVKHSVQYSAVIPKTMTLSSASEDMWRGCVVIARKRSEYDK